MKARGLTFVELVAVLAIGALLMALALPDLRAMVERQRLRAAVSDLLVAIEQARFQAISRGVRVLLVPNDARGADWAAGWTVLVDRDGDRRPGAGDTVLAVHEPLHKGITVASAFSSHQLPDYIAYNGVGRSCADTNGAAARWGSLTLSQGSQLRRIRINMLGRARACDPASDGAACEGGAAAP